MGVAAQVDQCFVNAVEFDTISDSDHERLVHFCKVLKTGLASGPEDEPIILLRDYLVANEKGRSALAVVRECYGKTQRALKAHLLGENLTKLYAVVAELFPLPEETH